MANLRREQIVQLRNAFRQVDDQAEGFIPSEGLGTVMRALGKNLTDPELQDLTNELDPNQNGVISFENFVDFIARQPVPRIPPTANFVAGSRRGGVDRNPASVLQGSTAVRPVQCSSCGAFFCPEKKKYHLSNCEATQPLKLEQKEGKVAQQRELKKSYSKKK